MDTTVKDMVEARTCKSFCGWVTSFLVLLSIILLSCSVKQVDRLHCGLALDTVSGVVDTSKVYPQGRHFIGVNRQFIMFPMYLNTIFFSDEQPEKNVQQLSVLRSRDIDGKQIQLDITVQYRLKPENVGTIYKAYTVLYEDIYIAELRGALQQATNSFAISEAWENYTNVSLILKSACVDALAPHYAECWGLQLWGIRLSSRYEDALVRTQIRKQAQRTEEARKIAAETRAKTQVILAEYKKNVTIIQSGGAAQQLIIQQQAISQAKANLIAAQSVALELVQNIVCLNSTRAGMNDSQLINYQRFMMLDKMKSAQLVVGAAGSFMESMDLHSR